MKRLAVAAGAALVLVLVALALSGVIGPGPFALPVLIVLEPAAVLTDALARRVDTVSVAAVAWILGCALLYVASRALSSLVGHLRPRHA